MTMYSVFCYCPGDTDPLDEHDRCTICGTQWQRKEEDKP